MTISEFSRDLVPIIDLAVTTIALSSLLLLWFQIRQTTRWNRLLSSHNFLNDTVFLEVHRALLAAGELIGVSLCGRNKPLTDEEVGKILSSNDAYVAVVAFLNEFENICGAVHAGVADTKVSYGIHSGRVIREYPVYEPFMEAIRKREGDEEDWIVFKKVYVDWKARRDVELKRRERDLKRVRSSVQPG
jgi:hypothetical protein